MKRGYLGLIESVYLAGRSAGYREFLVEQGISAPIESIPLDQMIYVAGFQGGIEKFITPLKLKPSQAIDAFLSKRISEPEHYQPESLGKLLDLKSALTLVEDDFETLKTLPFLHDLMAAMANNAAVINISGIPSIENVKRHFPPDIALPICNILSSLQATDELLPAPTQVLDADGVEKFKELLTSGVYSHYASAHQAIEFSSDPAAISEIRKRGNELLAAGKGVLFNRRVSIKLLSVVPKIVDAAFGKLPGALAQVGGDLASKFLSDRKNIVIYRFEDWVSEYTSESLRHAMRNQLKTS